MLKAAKNNNRWTVRVSYIGADAKRHQKRFTADKKAECEKMAIDFLAEIEAKKEAEKEKKVKLKFGDAANEFIKSRTAVLSPSTIYGYTSIANSAFDALKDVCIYEITREDIQRVVNNWSMIRSPKTVRNYYAFLCSVFKAYRPDYTLSPNLPRKKRASLYTPSDEDIKKLIKHIENTPLEIPVLLAALSSLRRSEICALCYEDIGNGFITVNKAMVYDINHEWVVKVPKTEAGYRTTYLPESVTTRIKKRGTSGRIIEMNPNQLSYAFSVAVKEADLPHFRLHALRSYYASILHALGVPDKYIMSWGGWHDEATLHQHYQKVMEDKMPEMAKIGIDHFVALIGE